MPVNLFQDGTLSALIDTDLGPVTWAAGPGWYRTGPSALELLVHEHQRSGTQSGAFTAETINYAAMHNGVVMIGHRSANGAVHTSVG
ncbi:MAG: hypothetical protein GX456_04425 [Verrucomicrobia bacterium]|nr:hypothetical protein [Verrucomicrobiota bacterium]